MVEEDEGAGADRDPVCRPEPGELGSTDERGHQDRRQVLVQGPRHSAQAYRQGLRHQGAHRSEMQPRHSGRQMPPAQNDVVRRHAGGGGQLGNADLPDVLRARDQKDHGEGEQRHAHRLRRRHQPQEIEALEQPVQVPGRQQQRGGIQRHQQAPHGREIEQKPAEQHRRSTDEGKTESRRRYVGSERRCAASLPSRFAGTDRPEAEVDEQQEHHRQRRRQLDGAVGLRSQRAGQIGEGHETGQLGHDLACRQGHIVTRQTQRRPPVGMAAMSSKSPHPETAGQLRRTSARCETARRGRPPCCARRRVEAAPGGGDQRRDPERRAPEPLRHRRSSRSRIRARIGGLRQANRCSAGL